MTHPLAPARSLGILLVEDETVAAINLECIVEDLGHRIVAVAVTPVQARRALRDQGHDIDVVVYGANLVGLSSLDFGRFLARNNHASVVTSSMDEPTLRGEGFEDPYLAKPFAQEDVVRLFRRVEAEVRRAA